MSTYSNTWGYILAYTKKAVGELDLKNMTFTRARDGEVWKLQGAIKREFLLQKYIPIALFFLITSLAFSLSSWSAISIAAAVMAVMAFEDEKKRYLLTIVAFGIGFLGFPVLMLKGQEQYFFSSNYVFIFLLFYAVYTFLIDIKSNHYKAAQGDNEISNKFFLSVNSSYPSRLIAITFLAIFLVSLPATIYQVYQANKTPEQKMNDLLKNKTALFPIEKKGITKDGEEVKLLPGKYSTKIIDNKTYYTNIEDPNIHGFLQEEKVHTKIKTDEDQKQALKKAEAIIDGRYYFNIPVGTIYYQCGSSSKIDLNECKKYKTSQVLENIIFDQKLQNNILLIKQGEKVFLFKRDELKSNGAK